MDRSSSSDANKFKQFKIEYFNSFQKRKLKTKGNGIYENTNSFMQKYDRGKQNPIMAFELSNKQPFAGIHFVSNLPKDAKQKTEKEMLA